MFILRLWGNRNLICISVMIFICLDNYGESQCYQLLELLGKGGSSKVFKAKDNNGDVYALKVIRKDKQIGYDASCNMLIREHESLQKFSHHPNIINSFGIDLNGTLECSGKTEQVVFNLLEYAQNGVLSYYVKQTGPFEAELCKFFSLQLCNALQLLHSEGFCHLDIKLENILLDEYFNIKLADLGSCVEVATTEGYTDRRRGTKMYMAPEIYHLNRGHKYNAYAADIYSLGITLFVIFTGYFPSQEERDNFATTAENCNDDTLSLHGENSCSNNNRWDSIPDGARQLIKSMINVDPNLRPTINEVLESDWLNQPTSEACLQVVYEEMNSRKLYAHDIKRK